MALFPRYLFVRMDVEAMRWRSILSTVGVMQLVCRGSDPCPVPDAAIAEIRRREDAAGYVALSPASSPHPGGQMQVTEGAFADCIGLVEALTDQQRVTLLIHMMGWPIRVTLGAESVRAHA